MRAAETARQERAIEVLKEASEPVRQYVSMSRHAPHPQPPTASTESAVQPVAVIDIGTTSIRMAVAEVHDATAMGEIIQSENLGFCEFGQGGVIAERGDTRIGGRIPINPSGGLESKGHPVGATGLAQVHELVTQLRAEAGARQVEGARIALAENGGGLEGIEEAVACITILAR